MNKKLKCLLAAALAIVLIVCSLAIPASAAQRDLAVPEGAVPARMSITETFSDKPDLSASSASSEERPAAVETKGVIATGATDPTEDPSKVGAVTSAKRTTSKTDVIGLSWNAVSGVKGYRVYWRNADSGGSFSLLTTVKSNAVTVRSLKAGAMYEFRINAYNTDKTRMYEGKSITVKAATNPIAVTDFRLTSGVPTGTVIKWTKKGLCDGFILYRQFDGKWSKYKTLGKDASSFTDTDVIPGRAYYYKICSYRKDSTGELTSDTALLRTVCGLCAPADNGTKSLLRKVYFKWKKNSYAHGYEIRYSTDGKTFKLLTDTNKLYYNTNRFADGKKYYFRIYPYRNVDIAGVKTKIYGTYTAKTMTITNSAYGKSVPKTYIEVNIEQQHMWFYLNDELYVSTDVVTGNYNSMDTPKGYWSINNKASPATLSGANYSTQVQYWMAFIGSGYGIHDATWRSSFGGTIYKGDGSHGCINTPYNNVKKIYSKAKVGTPVIVY